MPKKLRRNDDAPVREGELERLLGAPAGTPWLEISWRSPR